MHARIVKLEDIKSIPPRSSCDVLLQANIKNCGLTHPLYVDGSMNLVDGGERFHIIQDLGYTDVPVIVLTNDFEIWLSQEGTLDKITIELLADEERLE